MVLDVGRIKHRADLMHRSTGSNGNAVPSNWKLSADGLTNVVWTPEGAGSVSYGSNVNDVGPANVAGASALVTRADHVHRGVRTITAGGSNGRFGDVNFLAGTGITLGVSGQNVTITGGSAEDKTLVTVAATGSTETVDCSAARTYDLTLTANCTVTLTGAVTAEAHYLQIILRQDGTGSRTVTWPGSVSWIGGSAPTLQTAAGAYDIVAFLSIDGGTNWIGASGADATAALAAHLADATDAHDASAVSFIPSGLLVSTNAQDAIAEAAGLGGSGEDLSLVIVSATGATETIDCSTARVYRIRLDANCTLTLTGPGVLEAHRLRLLIQQDGTGSRTVTWPAAVLWPAGSAPSLSTGANRTDIVDLITVNNGGEWLGVLVAADYHTVAPPTGSGSMTFPMLGLTLDL